MDDITVLNELYKIVAMGIIGIDEVKGHIEDKTLAKTMSDAKKKYMVNKMDITKMLNELGEKPTEINIIIKTFNEIYTGIELIKCDDAKIAKMLTEGTNKGIIKVEEILNNNIDYKLIYISLAVVIVLTIVIAIIINLNNKKKKSNTVNNINNDINNINNN